MQRIGTTPKSRPRSISAFSRKNSLEGLTIHKAQTGEEAAAVVKNCHALLEAANASGSEIKKERLVRYYFLTAFAEFKVANLSAAEALYLRALEIAEKSKIATSQTWEILKDLGDIYRLQGDYARAEELLQRALAIREAASDENKANVAKIYNSQAEMYRAQGQYAKAEALYLKAIAIVEQSVGTNDPFLGIPLRNLAELYRNQGITQRRRNSICASWRCGFLPWIRIPMLLRYSTIALYCSAPKDNTAWRNSSTNVRCRFMNKPLVPSIPWLRRP